MRPRAAVILAAGKGIRMKSKMPKALCELCGKPMVEFLIDTVKRCGFKKIVVVGGYRIELLKKRLYSHKVKIVEQKKLLGSADAVKQTKGYFKNFNGTILVLCADTPLIKIATIKGMLRLHNGSKAAVTLLTGKTADPKEYGRILRDASGRACGIIEYSDISSSQLSALSSQQKASEINVGAYCFDAKRLFEGLSYIKKNKLKGEFYLTDIVAYFYKKGYGINSCTTTDADEILGINRKEELISAEEALRRRTIERLLEAGVIIKDPPNTYIQDGAKIGKETVIYPFVVIEDGVVIGKGCKVGPFAHLRYGTVLKDNSSIGNFVEVVRSRIDRFSRAKHHSYIGDALIGQNVNIGAGTITANYDRKEKNQTVIEDGAFIGSGTTIVAPVKIGKNAVTGAGSVVVRGRDVAPNTVVVGVPAKPLKSLKKTGSRR